MIWDSVFKGITNFLKPLDEGTQNNIVEQGIEENKTFTLKDPRSQRYTTIRQLAGGPDKKYKSWRPTGKSLSPNGFMQETELKKAREKNPELGTAFTESVPSTCLKTIKYDPAMESLTVQFQGKNHKKYWYPGVPASQIIDLMKAPSKGHYFLENIHDQYTLNPGHSPSQNKFNNSRKQTSYKYAQKQYNVAKKSLNSLGLATQQALMRSMRNQGTGKYIPEEPEK